MSFRLKIRPKITNVTEVNDRRVEGVFRYFWLITEELSDPGTFIIVPSREGNSEAGVGVNIILKFK